MAIRDLQRRLQEVGRIRLGPSMVGRDRPDKLDTFRFTSAHRHLVEEIAALYGGQMKPWGQQFEVITQTNTVPVYVPPQTIDPWYEQWGNGVCTRRCDGYRDIVHEQPCSCDPDQEKRTCKPVVRVNLMLADVPGLGVWRLESHGMNAVAELSMLTNVLSQVTVPLPARLVLRTEVRKFFNRERQRVEKREFPVPGLLFDQVTARQVQIGGDALTQALGGSEQPAQVEGPPQRQQIEQGPSSSAVVEDRQVSSAPQQPTGTRWTPNLVRERIAAATEPDHIKALWQQLAREQVRFNPELDKALQDRMTQRAQQLSDQRNQQQNTAAATRQAPPSAVGQVEDPFTVVGSPSEDPFDPPPQTVRHSEFPPPNTETVQAPILSTRDPWDTDPTDQTAQPDPRPDPPETPHEPVSVAPPRPETTTPVSEPPPGQWATKAEVWQVLMAEAGNRKWTSSQLQGQIKSMTGADGPASATVEQLQTVLDAVRNYPEGGATG